MTHFILIGFTGVLAHTAAILIFLAISAIALAGAALLGGALRGGAIPFTAILWFACGWGLVHTLKWIGF